MASIVALTIDTVAIEMEYPVEFLIDGTEEFNIGSFKIKNSSQRETYPDWADVVLTINGVDIEACIQKDMSVRTAPNVYEHTITLVEPVMKLSQYIMADRNYSTIDGNAITYQDQLDNILLTIVFGKTNPFTVATATQTLLDEIAVEKEYSGGDLLTTLTDMFRSVKAIPTLSLDNEIGHDLFGAEGNLITIENITGETIVSDIADYGMTVHSKVKNGTYEGDLITGGTYYPSKNEGITPRSTADKFKDEDAQYIIDSGIRRNVVANIFNLDIAGTLTKVDVGAFIVSKAEWDDLEIERDSATLYAGKYKNNTLYFVEGDNVYQNVGVNYKHDGALITGDPAIESLIKSFLTQTPPYFLADYRAQNIRDLEMNFFYQAARDMDLTVHRHNTDRVTKRATLINNQKDSKLELNRYGKALKSQINRVGNDSFEVTVRYNSLTPFTLWNKDDYTADGYKIIKLQMVARDNSLDVTYLFMKNQSILNPLTAVNRAVSPFTIQKRNTLTCFVYENYFELSTSPKVNNGLLTTAGRKALLNALKWDVNFDLPIYNAQYISSANGLQILNMSAVGIPMGQSLVFNAQFKEPKIAGNQLVTDTIGDKLKPIAYTDINGQVETFDMLFYNELPSSPDTLPVGSAGTNPLIDSITYDAGLNPNEILGLSSEQHLITNIPNLIWGDFFSENNSLIKELSLEQGTLLIYYPGTTKFNIYDRVAKAGSEGSTTYSINAAYTELDVSNVPNGKSWAIVKDTAPFEIYIAFNYEGVDYSTLYFNSLLTEPNTEVL